MKTLTPDQRMEGFVRLVDENENAHLASFLAGVAHAEKVLASQEQDDEPVAWSEYDPRGNLCALHRSFGDGLSKAEIEYGWKLEPLYLHPAPRKPLVRLTDEEIMDIYMKWINDNNGQPLGRAIEDALEEKNK